ncbi:ParB N-terminal domain-containing protein [Leucobacter chromiireducens]|uniref:ParB-like N-terminal domain-containing protein n=1 Tax=Leucobacter chromiireducens subsp. chromiireducens TaxID=660067 RepID=A0ABS1SQP4_9MICO|nr:ParB N-terminal domain-containing protein [Leucobacter chromiireducens]MBL3690487.1 hypothetical protein [Leucobacter chromiireducens subsp. chromiireducens]
MSAKTGHIELERAVESIWTGNRHRQDLGDLDALIESIAGDGLLQPITIAPDGMLICGARRLAAIRRIGWKTVNVWVRSGLSTRLGQLLAEQDDNLLHKPLTRTEEATLYAEVKVVIAEDAARRQEASRFTSLEENPRSDGAATVAAPSAGDTRKQAALLVTGRNAYTSLERINELQTCANDEAQPDDVRARARAELDGIDEGGSITGAQQRIHAAQSLSQLDALASDPAQPGGVRETAASGAARVRELEHTARAADLEQLALQALERAKSTTKRRSDKRIEQVLRPVAPSVQTILPTRSFVYLWNDLANWVDRYDPIVIGSELTTEQWEQFERTLAVSNEFAATARAARVQRREIA